MADPLAVSTGQGRGEAQVLPQSGKSPYDLYSDYITTKKKKETEGAKNAADAYKGLDDLKLDGFVKDTQYLYDKKNQLQNRIASQLQVNKGKYNTATDPELVRNLNKLQEMNEFSKNTKGLFNAELTKLQAGKDQWDPKTVEEVTTFYNLPIEERYDYINKGGKIPTLEPKAEVVDYIGEINKLDTPYARNAGEMKPKDGRIGTYDTKAVDELQLDNLADKYWTAGENNASKGAQKLMGIVKAKVDANPNAIVWTDAEKAQKTKEAFKDEFKKIKLSQAETSKNYGSKSAKEGFSFGGDGMLENDKYVYVVGDEKREEPSTTKEGEAVGAFGKKASTPVYNVKVVTPTPKRGGKNKIDEFTDKDGKVVVFSPEKAEQKESGEWVIIGTTAGEHPKKKEVPYVGNEGVWRGNFDGSPEQIYDETIKQRGQKSTGTGGSSGATSISKKTISLSDAKKANPGITDDELVKRYAKYGYKVK